MKARQIWRAAATALASLALAACATMPAAAPAAIIPAPLSLAPAGGGFVVDSGTPIVVTADDGEARRVAAYLSDLVERTRGLSLPVTNAGRGIVLRRSAAAPVGAEAYRLIVSPGGVIVEAREAAGLFYGATTLWQLLTAPEAGPSIPAVRIEDAPRFRWRGLMLDSARHYQSPAFIRQFIDTMALHKLNVLHWHLTDDQAWRLEIKRYPRLTQVGAWRVPAGAGPAADIDPATRRPRLYGGFYTQAEVREIVAYATARHIAIVPEIDMPGHASAAIAAYPQLSVLASPSRTVPADWGVYRNLFNVEEDTFVFLENVLGEVVDLFPGSYIHVGGDEAVKEQWDASPRVQQRMRALGVADTHRLQSYFIQRMERFLNARGRRLIGWDEILEGGLAPNATVMSWRGIDGAVAAAQAGHDAVLAAWPTLYFDNRQSTRASEPPGRGRVIGLRDVYAFDPAPAKLTPAQQQHVLGLQANIWTEHIRTEPRVWTMAFPRAAAIAELGWSPPAAISWESFSARLPAQMARYRALGVPVSDAELAPPPPPPGPKHRRSHDLSTCADKLVLSLEDDAPVRGERAVFLIDIMQPCWIWRGADLTGVRAVGAEVGQAPFNFQIGDDVHAIRFRPPATRAGELEVRLGCEGERIAVLPLAPAASNPAVTELPAMAIASRTGVHDLCFTFTARGVDPMYAIQSISLIGP